jgi:hypothetical protein
MFDSAFHTLPKIKLVIEAGLGVRRNVTKGLKKCPLTLCTATMSPDVTWGREGSKIGHKM